MGTSAQALSLQGEACAQQWEINRVDDEELPLPKFHTILSEYTRNEQRDSRNNVCCS